MENFKANMGIFRPLYRGFPIILLIVIIAIGIANKYLKYTTPMYESTAKIKLADLHEGVSNSNLFKDFDVFVTSNKIGAEVELLKSSVLIQKTLEKLDMKIAIYRVGDIHKTELYNQSPFVVEAELQNPKFYNVPFEVVVTNGSTIVIKTPSGNAISSKFNKVIKFDGGIISIKINKNLLAKRPDLKINDKYEFIINSDEKLVDKVISNLDVMAVDKDIPVLRISYLSAVPQQSADVVNALSATYIEDYIHQKYQSADTSANFLNNQLESYNKKLAVSENAREQYRINNNIVNISQETDTDLKKIADLKKQLAGVQMNLNAVDSLKFSLKNGSENLLELAPNFDTYTDFLSTEMVKKVKELQRDRRELLIRFTPGNDKVKVIDANLADIHQYLLESVDNTSHNLRIKYNDLTKSIANAEQVFESLPEKERNMTILDRDFGLNEQIYRFLHEKRTEAEIAKAATISFHRIIFVGEVPNKPVSPNSAIVKVLATILGLLGGIGAILFVHFIKNKVNDAAVIQRLSDLPIAASIPYLKQAKLIDMYFKRWALELDIKKLVEENTIITVSSFDAKEGCQFISNHLSAALRLIGKKVIYIDTAAIEENLINHNMWSNYLTKQRKNNEIIIVRNVPMAIDSTALNLLHIGHLNFVILDSRITTKNRITEMDNLSEELALENVQFVLNRAGYTPSIWSQLYLQILSLRKILKR